MVDFDNLMQIFSTPRPNGSEAEKQTSRAVRNWLKRNGIPYSVHSFRHYPYFFESIGIWIILSRTLLALSIWLRWGWLALPIALLGLVGGLVDVAFHLPVVSFSAARRGENILIAFEPGSPRSGRPKTRSASHNREAAASQEIVISAHYDSKTEPLDHNQRMLFLKSIPFGIALTLALGLFAPLEAVLSARGSAYAEFIYLAGVILTYPLLILALGLGLNMLLGRFQPPSQGAVDDGSACAILLGLAQRLSSGDVDLQKSKVTLALFTGEEVNMQGSRAYVDQRDWPLPSFAINLEAMAQDGDYVFWEQDGSVFKLEPTSPQLNRLVRESVAEITAKEPTPGGPVLSDGSSFISAGIPTSVLGTYDRQWKDSGFHRPSDNLDRVKMERLPEAIEILIHLLHKLDREQENASSQ